LNAESPTQVTQVERTPEPRTQEKKYNKKHITR